MRTTTYPLVGIPTNQNLSTAFSYSTPLGEFVGIYSITLEENNSPGNEIAIAVKEFSSHLTQAAQFVSFFQTLTLKKVIMAAGVISPNESIFFINGDAQIVLLRGKQVYPILDPSIVTSSNSPFMRGELTNSDDIFLGTTAFFSSIFPSVSSTLHPELRMESLRNDMSVIGANAHLAATLVQIRSEDISPQISLKPQESKKVFIPSSPLPSRLHSSPQRGVYKIFRGKKIVFGLVVLLFVGGMIIGANSLVLRRREARAEAALSPFVLRLDQAKKQPDKLQKIQALSGLLSDLQQSEAQYASDRLLSRRFRSLNDETREEYERISAQKDLSKLPVFYDFRLVAADFVASSLAFDQPGKLALCLDRSQNRLLSLSLENKSPQTLSISDKVSSSFAVAVEDRKAYVVGVEGIVELSLPLDTAGKLVANSPAGWQPRLLSTFGTNAYVLDKTQRNVLRFDLTNPTSSPSGWVKDKEGVDFENISSLVVDGELWMGTANGEVLRFNRGEQVPFRLEDAVGLPNSSISIYTTPASSLLYVLEPRGKRLLLYTKDGNYVSSIISPDLETASSLIVDEQMQTAYILAGSLIYTVKIPISPASF